MPHDATEQDHRILFLSFKISTFKIYFSVSISESGFGGNKFQLFGAFALVAGPQNLHLAC